MIAEESEMAEAMMQRGSKAAKAWVLALASVASFMVALDG
jgi:hypothetical protein